MDLCVLHSCVMINSMGVNYDLFTDYTDDIWCYNQARDRGKFFFFLILMCS